MLTTFVGLLQSRGMFGRSAVSFQMVQATGRRGDILVKGDISNRANTRIADSAMPTRQLADAPERVASECVAEPLAERPLRVVLITPRVQMSGGIGRLMSSVLAELPPDRGVVVHVLDTRGRSRRASLSCFPLLRSWGQLVVLAAARRVDLAHVNISSRGSTIRKSLMVWTCWSLRIPVVLHLHASSYPEFFEALPSVPKSFIRKTFRRANVVIALGTSSKVYVCEELQVRPRAVAVMPNAASGPPQATALPRDAGAPLKFVFLGRLCPRKGTSELLSALSDARLRSERWIATLAGDGDVAAYQAEAQRLGIEDRLSFPGWVDETTVAHLLRDSHVLVLPSRAEGLPVAVIEAFANALAVVTTPVGSIPDVVQDGINGLLVAPRDSHALADALLLLLHHDEIRCELGRRARETWSERLTATAYATELAALWIRTARETARA